MTVKLIDQLIEDFELNSNKENLKALNEIKASHLKEIASLKPKPRVFKAKAPEQKFKLEIIEGSNTFEVLLNSEKELDKYLKDKQKFRKASLDKWMGQNSVHIPDPKYYGISSHDKYKRDCAEHTASLLKAGLNFEVKIIRC